MSRTNFRRLTTILAAVAIFTVSGLALAANDDVTYPAVKGYGNIVPLPNAAVQPDKNTQYKVVFDVTSAGEAKGVNSPLFHIARAVNIMVSAGVPLKNLHYVAIIHGAATHIVMDNAHYKLRYHKDNPNLDLIAKLKAAGVDVQVCGQALHGEHIDQAWVDKNVTITLSALSTNIIYETMGYAYISM